MSAYSPRGGSCLVEARSTIQPNGVPTIPMMARGDIDRSNLALDPAGGCAPRIPSLNTGSEYYTRIGGTPGSERRRIAEPMVPLAPPPMFADNLHSPPRSKPVSPREYLARSRLDFEGRGFPAPGQRSASMPPARRLPYAPLYTPVSTLGYDMVPPPLPPMQFVSQVTGHPPLPPVRPELLARLKALENSLQQQDAHQSDVTLSQLLREDLWAAQDAERRARTELDLEKRKLLSENQQLREEIQALRMQHSFATQKQLEATVDKDINDLRALRDAERREREELELRHKDVARSHKQLQDDFQKLQGDLRSEQEAHRRTRSLHDTVNSDVDRLKEDMRKQREAHANELNSSVRDKDQNHRKSEEATARVMRDFEKLQADREAEQRAREFAEAKVREITNDVVTLKADIDKANAARDAEQREKEEVQRRHRDVEAEQRKLADDYALLDYDHKKLKNDYDLQLQSLRSSLTDKSQQVSALGQMQIEKDSLELSYRELQSENLRLASHVAELKKNFERVPTTDLQQKIDKLEMERADMLIEKARLEQSEASVRNDLREARERARDMDTENFTFRRVKSEKDQLEGDVERLKEAIRSHEQAEWSLRQQLKDEQGKSSMIQADMDLIKGELDRDRQIHQAQLEAAISKASKPNASEEELRRIMELQGNEVARLRQIEDEHRGLKGVELKLIDVEAKAADRERKLQAELLQARNDIKALRSANEERELEARKLRDAHGEFETGVKALEEYQEGSLAEMLRRKSSMASMASVPFSATSSLYSGGDTMSQVGSLGGFQRWSTAQQGGNTAFDLTGATAVEMESGSNTSEEFVMDDANLGGARASLLVDLTGDDDEADMQVLDNSLKSGIGNVVSSLGPLRKTVAFQRPSLS